MVSLFGSGLKLPHSSFDFFASTVSHGIWLWFLANTINSPNIYEYDLLIDNCSIQDVSILKYEVKCCNCRTFKQDFAVKKMPLITTNAPSRLRLNTSEINLPLFASPSVRQSGAFFVSFLPTLSASGKSHQIPPRAGEPLGCLWDGEDLWASSLCPRKYFSLL